MAVEASPGIIEGAGDRTVCGSINCEGWVGRPARNCCERADGGRVVSALTQVAVEHLLRDPGTAEAGIA